MSNINVTWQVAFTTPDGTTTDQFTFGATQLSGGKYYFTPGPGLGALEARWRWRPAGGSARRKSMCRCTP